MAEVACVGILVADIVASPIDSLPDAGQLRLMDRYVLSVGGCAANTAVDLRRLGRTAAVLGKVGDDLFGDFILRDLERLGVDASAVTKSALYPTSCTLIVNVRGQDRRFVHCFGANADFSLADVNSATLNQARALYVGGYLVMPAFPQQQLVQLFSDAKRRGLITALDVVIPEGYRASLRDVEKLLPLTDVFLPNNDEARALTGKDNPIEQAQILSAINPQCIVVITQGRDGALVRRGDEVLRAGIFQVQTIDSSGGGDAFDAGFLFGMLEGWPLEQTLRFASAIGASCTRALGCTEGVFTYEEAQEFLSQHPLPVERLPRSA